MSQAINDFVKKAREQGLNDGQIKQKLVENGWSEAEVDNKINGSSNELVVPKPPSENGPSIKPIHNQYDANNPIPVVNNLSTKGFEYSIMFVSLWAVALSLSIQINSLISSSFTTKSTEYYDYSSGFDAFWITVLVVFAPVLTILFLRLKKQEIAEPAQLKDPSRRRLSHFTQFATFITGAIILIYFIYSLMSGNVGSDGNMGFSELALHVLFTLAVTGAIFAYYWAEEHKSNRIK